MSSIARPYCTSAYTIVLCGDSGEPPIVTKWRVWFNLLGNLNKHSESIPYNESSHYKATGQDLFVRAGTGTGTRLVEHNMIIDEFVTSWSFEKINPPTNLLMTLLVPRL